MNLNPKDIKKTTKALFQATKGKSHMNTLHPKRDWFIGVCIAVVLFASIVIWSAVTYATYRGGVTIDENVTVANPSYQAAAVEQALDVFVQRSANFSLLSSGSTPQPAEPEPADVAATTTSEVLEELDTDQQEDVEPDEPSPVTDSDEIELTQ